MNEGQLPPQILEIIESVATRQPSTVEDFLKWLLTAFSSKLLSKSSQSQHSDDEYEVEHDEGSDMDFYEDHFDDDYPGLTTSSSNPGIDTSFLQR